MINKIIIFIIGLAAAAGIYIYEIKPRLQAYDYICNMSINEINLNKIPDLTGEGEFSLSDVYCKVKVSVKNNKIESIEVVKNNSNDLAKKAEKVIERVIQAQSLKVECISGATGTSKAILKSIENALTR